MSADWFCKIGEKKVGPLNGQQLKTIVSKGQLKPEHLVRRGSEGPWVPAGRIKGLFPGGAAGDGKSQPKGSPATKPLPKAAKAGSLPTAAEAPAPPPADIPEELAMGGQHKRHVQLDVDKFNIEATPVMMSRRKMKGGLKGLKKAEQQKAKVILFSLIGGGMAIVLIVFVVAIAKGWLSSAPQSTPEVALNAPTAANTAKAETPKSTAAKVEKAAWPRSFKTVSVEPTVVGNVEVMVLKPVRGPRPPEVKSEESEVLIVPVNLQLKGAGKKPVEFTSWFDEHVRKDVVLKDEAEEGKGHSYKLLGMTVKGGGEAKTITENRITVRLIFELPADMPKTMYLALPSSNLHGDGSMIAYKFESSEVTTETPKTVAAGSGANADGEHKNDAK